MPFPVSLMRKQAQGPDDLPRPPRLVAGGWPRCHEMSWWNSVPGMVEAQAPVLCGCSAVVSHLFPPRLPGSLCPSASGASRASAASQAQGKRLRTNGDASYGHLWRPGGQVSVAVDALEDTTLSRFLALPSEQGWAEAGPGGRVDPAGTRLDITLWPCAFQQDSP